MSKLTLHPLSVVIGLVLAGLVVLTTSQAHTPSPLPNRYWPPHPSEIVNVSGADTIVGTVQIPVGGTYPLFAVPPDSWLVITGVSGNNGALALAEDLSGVVTYKRRFSASAGDLIPQADGPLGWTFHPGSTVVVKNVDTAFAQGLGGNYSFLGYLAR